MMFTRLREPAVQALVSEGASQITAHALRRAAVPPGA